MGNAWEEPRGGPNVEEGTDWRTASAACRETLDTGGGADHYRKYNGRYAFSTIQNGRKFV